MPQSKNYDLVVKYSILFPPDKIHHDSVTLQGEYSREEVLAWIGEENPNVGRAISVSFVATFYDPQTHQRHDFTESTSGEEVFNLLVARQERETEQNPPQTLEGILQSGRRGMNESLSEAEVIDLLIGCKPLADKLLSEVPGFIPHDYRLTSTELQIMKIFEKIWSEAVAIISLQLPSKLAQKAGFSKKQYDKLFELRSLMQRRHELGKNEATGQDEFAESSPLFLSSL